MDGDVPDVGSTLGSTCWQLCDINVHMLPCQQQLPAPCQLGIWNLDLAGTKCDLFQDVARGQSEWYPAPKEAAQMVSAYYGVSNNLLIQFQEDDIDQTPILVDLLKEGDLPHRVRLVTLEGGHNRPALQNFVDMPAPVASMIRSSIEGSSTILGRYLHSSISGTPLICRQMFAVLVMSLQAVCQTLLQIWA